MKYKASRTTTSILALILAALAFAACGNEELSDAVDASVANLVDLED
ncbi:hypothetical protein [Pelagicoccus albus]|uniref:Uncharacterized protein n=1 Tax=Pelagicoccus albus TaxID=415222 RepID=A0A7X1B6J6_9BACT|nr:hypothetical protein [Pelagicoccus albus]MBC2606599.1 hypothetical protein [Pelagicoccus albus]